jgi:predicted esterase
MGRRASAALAALLFLAAAAARAQDDPEGPDEEGRARKEEPGLEAKRKDEIVTVKVAKPESVYQLFVPPDRDRLRSLPLLVVLHPERVPAADAAAWFAPLARERGWVVVAPETRALRWLDPDGDIVLAAIADARKRVPLDPDRICLAGVSSGALMATRWGLEHPELWAAVVAHSGVQVRGVSKEAARLPILLSVGEADEEYLPEIRSAAAELKKAGLEPEVATWPGLDHDTVRPEVWERAFRFLEERLARPALRVERIEHARKERRWADAATEIRALLGGDVDRKWRLEGERLRRIVDQAGADLVKKARNRARLEPDAGRREIEDLAKAFDGFDTADRAREALAELDAPPK